MEKIKSPLKIVILLGIGIFVVETAIMLVFEFVGIPSAEGSIYKPYIRVLLNSIALLILISPVLYLLYNECNKRIKYENKLRSIYEGTEEAMRIIDKDFNIIMVNSRMAEISGVPIEKQIGAKCFDVFPSDACGTGFCTLKRVLLGESVMYEEKLRKSKKGKIWTRHIAIPLKDSEGKIIGVIEAFRDITKRKRIEEKLRESEEKYRTLTEKSLTGVYIFQNGKFIFVNQKFCDIFGYSKEELIGKEFWKLVHPDHREIVKERGLKRERGEKIPEQYEIKVITKDGKTKWVEMRATQINYSSKPAVMGNLVDITEKKKAGSELRKYAEELEKTNKLKDIFIDILRHDLLNPISVIEGMSRLVLEEEDREDIRRELNLILKNVEKVKSLIERASLLGKLESKEKLEFKQIELREIINEVIEDYSQISKEKIIKIKANLPSKEIIIEANPIIREVFSNLISNAMKYSPENTTIEVGLQEKNNKILCYVKDEGTGIPDEYKKSIFERFKRIKKEGVKGSGLGLAIVKRLVELHNGRVWVEDNKPRGSIFYVELPKNQ